MRWLVGMAMAMAGEKIADELKRDYVNRLVVSTVKGYDYGWETAILDSKNAHPVERYKTKRAALAGHKKWIAWARSAKRGTKIVSIGPEERRDWDEIVSIEPLSEPNPYLKDPTVSFPDGKPKGAA